MYPAKLNEHSTSADVTGTGIKNLAQRAKVLVEVHVGQKFVRDTQSAELDRAEMNRKMHNNPNEQDYGKGTKKHVHPPMHPCQAMVAVVASDEKEEDKARQWSRSVVRGSGRRGGQ